MRLICPNCDAQYEVDDSAIPEAGRDVQCSNCGHAWFQEREVEADDLTADLYREPEAPVPAPAAVAQEADAEDYEQEDAQQPAPLAGPAPIQRSLDDSVLAVLREEAEREVAARRAEATGIEVQGDLGLPPPVPPMVGSAAAASVASLTETERRIAALKGEHVAPARPAARRDLLPDIEEINSSLRPNEVAPSQPEPDLPDLGKSRSGFQSGFAIVLIMALLGVILYVMAPQISVQIPGAADTMTAYVAAVDSARITLDDLMRRATGVLNGLTGG